MDSTLLLLRDQNHHGIACSRTFRPSENNHKNFSHPIRCVAIGGERGTNYVNLWPANVNGVQSDVFYADGADQFIQSQRYYHISCSFASRPCSLSASDPNRLFLLCVFCRESWRSLFEMEGCILDTKNRLSCLSIVVDDVDERRQKARKTSVNKDISPDIRQDRLDNPYPKHVLEAAVRDMKEEAALRRVEFCKLIDEHEALVKSLEKMEKENTPIHICKMAIMT